MTALAAGPESLNIMLQASRRHTVRSTRRTLWSDPNRKGGSSGAPFSVRCRHQESNHNLDQANRTTTGQWHTVRSTRGILWSDPNRRGGSSGAPSSVWCRHQESNPGPTDYKSVALPAELCRQISVMGAHYWSMRPAKQEDIGRRRQSGQLDSSLRRTFSSPNRSMIAPAPRPGGSATSTK